MQQNQSTRASDHITLVKSFAGNQGHRMLVKKPHFIDHMLLGGILKSLGNPPLRVILWDGREICGA
jgi:hypothetical protein